MRRVFQEVAHDLKEPGIHMWMIPLVLLIFILMTNFVQKSLDIAGRQNVLTLALQELLMPSLGGYGALMLMQGLLDTEGGELAFTYPRTRVYWGLIRQMRFFILYTLLAIAECAAVTSIMRIEFAPIFYLTLAQNFAVMAVSFIGVTLGRKVSIGLIVLVAFVGIQITLGREYNILNWIYALDGLVPSYERLNLLALNAFLIGVFGWGIGQIWLRP